MYIDIDSLRKISIHNLSIEEANNLANLLLKIENLNERITTLAQLLKAEVMSAQNRFIEK